MSRSPSSGREASRYRRLTIWMSPSSLTDTSPDFMSGASAVKRAQNVPAGKSSMRDKMGIVTLINLRA